MASEATIDTAVSDGLISRRPVLVVHWLFPDTAPRRLTLLAPGVTLGRSPECTVQLDGPGVSRRHARITREGPAFVIYDEQSRNGTYVGGARVPCTTLRAGMVLRLGEFVGVVESRLLGEAARFGEIGPGLLGGDVLRAALEPARQAARSDLPLLLIAPTGCGKERVARCLHEWSGRPGAFRAVNCAALPSSLVEATLFGHRRGAFTGADHGAPGYFRDSHRGTLLFDEVLELPLDAQAKLLRVLQEREVTPVGESAGTAVDVRVIAAAQVPLAEAVKQGRFRADLYMRLRGLEVCLPSLGERIADVPPLFQYFLAQQQLPVPPLEAKLIERLCLHDWPGNVRELEWTARQLMAVHGGEPTLKARLLPASIAALPSPTIPPTAEPMRETGGDNAPGNRKDFDLARLARSLLDHGGNLSAACASINISRQRAYRLLAGRSVEELMTEQRR